MEFFEDSAPDLDLVVFRGLHFWTTFNCFFVVTWIHHDSDKLKTCGRSVRG